MDLNKAKRFLTSNVELIASLVAAVLFVAVIFPYVLNFGGAWSKSNEVWAQFGDYIGGSLNPIFGLLTLLVILFNTRMQRKEIESNRRTMLAHSEMMNRQLELMEQKAIEEFTFQLLEEARTDEFVQRARSDEWETLVGVYILCVNEAGEYEINTETYDKRVRFAEQHFADHVGIELGEFVHVVYPKFLAIVACTNKLPQQNRIFLTNLIKTRFGLALISALVQFSIAAGRTAEYKEIKKLTPLLQGAGSQLLFSEQVCKDFFKWESADKTNDRIVKAKAAMAKELAQRQNKSE